MAALAHVREAAGELHMYILVLWFLHKKQMTEDKGVFLVVMATLIIEMLTTSCLRRSGRSLLTFKKHILKKWISQLGNFGQPLHIMELLTI